MKDPRTRIPKKFWHNSQKTPSARTVGGLIKILEQLPPRMLINGRDAEIDVPALFVSVSNIDDDETRSVNIDTDDL